MFAATRVLRQAAAHAERVPSIKFIGRRTIPASVDHTPKPHPASPTHSLPANWGSSPSFSAYRQHAQQHGPLRKTIRPEVDGIGGSPGAALGSVNPPQGLYFDRNDLPARFRRQPLTEAEIEAIESGCGFA
ncbi:hypothetical protein NEUTE1DRAFT_95827 [Neurospora tetrasperma FGSC 2508]|uniref:Uncharacterized protein n=2 Tax=Neurospora TaxID=5140 RepID=A0AAJ0I135_9PEZI|nr:uncharacterized protein NEUTE1DRAFT_95827 [Neurospora tetrasperma FGSC 2508]EGO55798.1 hypothetical protein NEUTE1DRAFT_95827 [Neurospora tetrasperma FGSC 2508]EGZ68948.1 hypothetical protein NEUTE2DRAFT_122032 [Neurospora tetrasperma FGSC 2509]KAK3486732.1 hypothetical protein B0T23DRAFT_232690 [Neurospora hispaniola]